MRTVRTSTLRSLRPPRASRQAAWILGVALAYFLAGRLGLSLTFVHASASPVWPPTGIAIAAALLLGLWIWPAFLAGAFAFNLMTSGHVATSLLIGVGNTLEALVAAFLVRRFADGLASFDSVPGVLKYAFLAAGLATTVSAGVGVTSLTLFGLAPAAGYGPIWLTWWLGDAAGALVVAPALILWGRHLFARDGLREAPYGEIALLCTLALGVGFVTFAAPGIGDLAHALLFTTLVAILLGAALRTGALGASLALVIVGSFSVWGTLQGTGPFILPTPNESLLMLDLFLVTANVGTLAVAASTAARPTDAPATRPHGRSGG